eukprot:GHVT01050266.1.p1 GENE.GHVT01050266.1~~GHVT01050266.1.p1  ORF type:complete len:151 (+),score=6.37 GHVT01050266.1:1117-1569(+)
MDGVATGSRPSSWCYCLSVVGVRIVAVLYVIIFSIAGRWLVHAATVKCQSSPCSLSTWSFTHPLASAVPLASLADWSESEFENAISPPSRVTTKIRRNRDEPSSASRVNTRCSSRAINIAMALQSPSQGTTTKPTANAWGTHTAAGIFNL